MRVRSSSILNEVLPIILQKFSNNYHHVFVCVLLAMNTENLRLLKKIVAYKFRQIVGAKNILPIHMLSNIHHWDVISNLFFLLIFQRS